MIGIFCHHRYFHNDRIGARQLPKSLKGVDYAFHAACQKNGLEVKVSPILLINDDCGGITIEDYCTAEAFEVSDSALQRLREAQRRGHKDFELEYEDEDPSDDESPRHNCQPYKRSLSTDNVKLRTEDLLRRHVKGIEKRPVTGREVTGGFDFTPMKLRNHHDGFDSLDHVSFPMKSILSKAADCFLFTVSGPMLSSPDSKHGPLAKPSSNQ